MDDGGGKYPLFRLQVTPISEGFLVYVSYTVSVLTQEVEYRVLIKEVSY